MRRSTRHLIVVLGDQFNADAAAFDGFDPGPDVVAMAEVAAESEHVWSAEHRDYQHGRSFTDLQLAGPFRYWKHVHRMVPQGPQASVLEDAIEYELPLGTIGWLVGRFFVQRRLKRLFAFRHAVTLQAFEHPPV